MRKHCHPTGDEVEVEGGVLDLAADFTHHQLEFEAGGRRASLLMKSYT